jgi:murein DD-endopeptidase MepM/ murein hydrolase activator NlpD
MRMLSCRPLESSRRNEGYIIVKKRLFLLFLTGSTLFGCVNGPRPSGTAWPWSRDKDYDRLKTGGYIGVAGDVAQFDAAPQATKPVSAESLLSEEAPAARPSQAPAVVPVATIRASAAEAGSGAGTGEFTVTDTPVVPPAYLPSDAVGTLRDITAHNPGKATVSVAIALDSDSSYNVSADKPLPIYAVLAPGTEQAVVRLSPKNRKDRFQFRYRYTWSIGDYRGTHRCSEGYRFPFPGTVRATASATAGSTGPGRYLVVFLLPKETAVLPARKGVVVQIKSDQIEILHDDGTIGSYGNFAKVKEGVVVGKEVSTDDVIGTAGRLGNEDQAYLEFSVWAPRVPFDASPRAAERGGFDVESYPLEFCSTAWSRCREVKQDEVVSRNAIPIKEKLKKRRTAKASSGGN